MKHFLLFAAVILLASPALATADDSAADTLGVMYWTDRTAGIYRASRDGSEIQLIVPRTIIDSIAIDAEGDRLYWTHITGRGLKSVELWQGKLDGSVPVRLADDINWCGDVVFDPVDKRIYVSSLGDGKIICFDADGSGRRDFLAGLPPPSRLFVDAKNRKLYWAEKGKISQSNLDGSAIEVLVSGKTDLYSSLEILPPKE